MPLSFLGKNSKRRSATLIKLLTHPHLIFCISIEMMITSSREIAIFYQTVEMGTSHPKLGREIGR